MFNGPASVMSITSCSLKLSTSATPVTLMRMRLSMWMLCARGRSFDKSLSLRSVMHNPPKADNTIPSTRSYAKHGTGMLGVMEKSKACTTNIVAKREKDVKTLEALLDTG